MAWTAPRTYTAGEIITASILNSAVRDNLRYLKGLDGVPTIESGLTIDNTDGDERLLLPLLSTAECSTVLNAEGEVAFDELTHQMKEYDGTGIRALISEADVDNTPVNGATTVPVSSSWAYNFINILTTQADLPYATAAGTWARLAKGTAGQRLSMNSGATAPEWATVAGIAIAQDTYTGNDTADRAIPHGLGVIPKFVAIATTLTWGLEFAGVAAVLYNDAAALGAYAVTAPDATNFYIGNATSYARSLNSNGLTYYWVALS